MARFRNVCNVADVPEGESRMFFVDELRIGIFRLGQDYFALDDHCPHAGASLAHGLIDGDVVSCRIHHWRFCIRDGTYLDEARPACDVPTYTVRVVGEQLQVEI